MEGSQNLHFTALKCSAVMPDRATLFSSQLVIKSFAAAQCHQIKAPWKESLHTPKADTPSTPLKPALKQLRGAGGQPCDSGPALRARARGRCHKAPCWGMCRSRLALALLHIKKLLVCSLFKSGLCKAKWSVFASPWITALAQNSFTIIGP